MKRLKLFYYVTYHVSSRVSQKLFETLKKQLTREPYKTFLHELLLYRIDNLSKFK